MLESTQKFTADGVAHSSIPALRSNDEATGCPLPFPISRVPPFFSCRLVASSRRESSHQLPLRRSTIFQYESETKRKEITETFLVSPERKSRLPCICGYTHVFLLLVWLEKFTRQVGQDRLEIGGGVQSGCFRSTKILLNAYGPRDRLLDAY